MTMDDESGLGLSHYVHYSPILAEYIFWKPEIKTLNICETKLCLFYHPKTIPFCLHVFARLGRHDE